MPLARGPLRGGGAATGGPGPCSSEMHVRGLRGDGSQSRGQVTAVHRRVRARDQPQHEAAAQAAAGHGGGSSHGRGHAWLALWPQGRDTASDVTSPAGQGPGECRPPILPSWFPGGSSPGQTLP